MTTHSSLSFGSLPSIAASTLRSGTTWRRTSVESPSERQLPRRRAGELPRLLRCAGQLLERASSLRAAWSEPARSRSGPRGCGPARPNLAACSAGSCGGFSGQAERDRASKSSGSGWLCTSDTKRMPAAPFSWAVSALRNGVAASLMTTPSNGLLGSFSPGSWSRTRTILSRTSRLSVIVMAAFGSVDAEAGEDDTRPGHPAFSGGAEMQGNELLPGAQTSARSRRNVQVIGRAKARRDEVEAVEIRTRRPRSA